MSLNALGLGLVFTAKDLATHVIHGLEKTLHHMGGEAEKVGEQLEHGLKKMAGGGGIAFVAHEGLEFFAEAGAEAAEFGAEIAKVATRVDEAVISQEQMREITEKLARDFGKMPVEEVKALNTVIASGARDAAEAEEMLHAASKLAVAGNADLQATTTALTGTLKAFKLEADSAGDVSDTLFVAMRAGRLSIDDLNSAMRTAGPVASVMGIGFKELSGAIATATQEGMDAGAAVGGLHGFMQGLLRPLGRAKEEMARLGVSFDTATLRQKGLLGTIKAITSASGYNADTFSKLFRSTEAIAFATKLAEGNGSAFAAVLDQMNDAAGATQKGFEIMDATTDQLNKKIASSTAEAMDRLSTPITRKMAEMKLAVLDAFLSLPEPMVKFLATFAHAALLFTFFVGTIIAAKAAIGMFLAVLPFLTAALAPLLEIAAVLALAIGAAVAVFALLRTVFERDLGGIATFVSETVGKIRLFWEGLVQAFTEGGFSGAVMEELNKAENAGIKNFVIKLYAYWYRVQKFFEGFADAFSSVLAPLEPALASLVAAFGTIFDHIGDMLGTTSAKALGHGDTWSKVGNVIGMVISFIARNIAYFASIAIDVFTMVILWVNAIIDVFSAVGQVVAGVIGVIVGLLTGDWALAWESAKGIVGGVARFILAQLATVAESAALIIDSIGKFFGKDLGAAEAVRRIRGDVQAEISKFEAPGEGGAIAAEAASSIGAGVRVGARGRFGVPARPGVAAVEGQAALMSMIPDAMQSQVLESHVTLEVDGATLAETVEKHQQTQKTANFSGFDREH